MDKFRGTKIFPLLNLAEVCGSEVAPSDARTKARFEHLVLSSDYLPDNAILPTFIRSAKLVQSKLRASLSASIRALGNGEAQRLKKVNGEEPD